MPFCFKASIPREAQTQTYDNEALEPDVITCDGNYNNDVTHCTGFYGADVEVVADQLELKSKIRADNDDTALKNGNSKKTSPILTAKLVTGLC